MLDAVYILDAGGIGYETVVCGWHRTGQSGKNDV